MLGNSSACNSEFCDVDMRGKLRPFGHNFSGPILKIIRTLKHLSQDMNHQFFLQIITHTKFPSSGTTRSQLWQGFEKTYQKLSKQEAFCQSNKLVFVFYYKLQFSAIWELAILDKAKNLPQVCKTFTYNTKQILSVAASTQVCFHVYEISLFGDSVELTLRWWALNYSLPLNFPFPLIWQKDLFER